MDHLAGDVPPKDVAGAGRAVMMSGDHKHSDRSTYFFVQPGSLSKDLLEGKYACRQPPGENQSVAKEGAVPLRRYAGQYWWVQVREGNRKGSTHHALSTEQIAEALDRGATVVAIRGPYSSLKEASDRMEDYWEAIMGGDDE
jgi:hypothetical protein